MMPPMGGAPMPPPGMVPPMMPSAAPMGMAGPTPPLPMVPPPSPIPMPSVSPMPAQMQSPNITSILDRMLKPPIQPKYPPGFEKPKKPSVEEIITRAENAREANREFLSLVSNTLNRLRPSSGFGGFYEKDRFALISGEMEQYRAPILIRAHNREVSYLASKPIAYNIDVYDPELYADAQKIEDAAYHFRAMHERRWVNGGNPILSQCEASDILTYGVVIKRNTLNLADTKCPIKSMLIDPATVFPVWGRTGVINELEAVYRIVTMPVRQVLAEYTKVGDLKKKIKDALGDTEGTFGEAADVTVVEYWDSWWCGAFLCEGGVEIKPLTAHEYGCVPYIIQYGPGGEPMHTRMPNGTNGAYIEDYATFDGNRSGNGAERTHKATPFIEPYKYENDAREAFRTKVLTNVIKQFNPPIVLKRTNAGAKGEQPEFENWEGGVTELEAGEEDIEAYPETANRDAGLIFQMMAEDGTLGMLDRSDGMPDKSNISGTARQGMAEVGQEQREMWVRSLESLHGREATHDVCKLWRNHGHEARYAEGTKKPFYVPSRNPTSIEDRSFELTPEMIDNVDTDINASMNSLKLSEMMTFAQAMTALGPDSATPIYTLEDIARKAGVTDIVRVMQDNQKYRMIKKVMDLEETGKLVLAPQALKQAIRDAEGDPELQADLQETLDMWMTAVMQPMQAKIDQSMAPPAPPPAMGQGVAGGAGAPYAAQGQGPGSQGGAVGAPPQELSGPPMG